MGDSQCQLLMIYSYHFLDCTQYIAYVTEYVCTPAIKLEPFVRQHTRLNRKSHIYFIK